MMRRAFNILLLLLLLSIPAFAQSVCVVSDTVLTIGGSPAAGATIIVTPVSASGAVSGASLPPVIADAEGDIEFTVLQNSIIRMQGAVILNGANLSGGRTVRVPASSTANASALVSVAQVPATGLTVRDEGLSLPTLVGTMNFVGAGVVVTQPSGGVATVTIAGVGGSTLDDLSDVTITSVANGDFVKRVGGVWANSTSGDSLTALNASSLASGTLPDARFPSTLPAVSGANLTALNASSLGSGTVPDARFPATLPALSGANLTALNASNLASGTIPDARFPATLPALSGANLTALSASNLASGTIPDARFPSTLPALNGSLLTTLNASSLASGTVPTARLGSGTANSGTFLRGDSTWSAISATPGGSDTQVQFNDAGAFGGDSALLFNKTTNLLTLTGGKFALDVNGTGGIAIGPNNPVVGTSGIRIGSGGESGSEGVSGGHQGEAIGLGATQWGYAGKANADNASSSGDNVHLLTSAARSIVIASGITVNTSDVIIIGGGAGDTTHLTESFSYFTAGDFYMGISQSPVAVATIGVRRVIIGRGFENENAEDISIRPTAIKGSNGAGKKLTLLGGASTGTGLGGPIELGTTSAGSSGSSLNSYTTVQLAVPFNNVLALRNSTTGQSLRINNSFTDESNQEYVRLNWNANAFSIEHIGAGTGATNRNIILNAKGTGGAVDSAWLIDVATSGGSNAYWVPGTDNLQGIGFGNRRVKEFVGGQINFSDGTSRDTGLHRASAGMLEVNSSSTGTWRDLKVRQYYVDATITAGATTGDQTINKAAGTVNIAAAGSSITITSNLITTSSLVFAIARTNDTTCSVKNAVPGSGSVVITMTAACTAETSVAFWVLNK